MNRRMTTILALSALTMQSGCASMQAPRNLPSAYYAAEQYGVYERWAADCQTSARPAHFAAVNQMAAERLFDGIERLGPGDRLRLSVTGDDNMLSRTYVIGADGRIMLAGRFGIAIAGRTLAQAEGDIASRLREEQLVRWGYGGVRLSLIELGAVDVAIAGAVFEPGVKQVGGRTAEQLNLVLDQKDSGDRNGARTLTNALQAGGGIRPDADLAQVIVARGGKWAQIDLRPVIEGGWYQDIALSPGDQIYVPSRGCFQQALVRPTRVTIPGIRVYMSNLSRPAVHNAGSAIGKEATSLPYGTRLSQAMVSANCVGGSAMNADRRVVLISRNPANGQSVVIERSVERLVRGADRDERDPYLMPGDALACYDSLAMNVRDVISVVGETLTPAILLNNLN